MSMLSGLKFIPREHVEKVSLLTLSHHTVEIHRDEIA